jgi:hypothetical protein
MVFASEEHGTAKQFLKHNSVSGRLDPSIRFSGNTQPNLRKPKYSETLAYSIEKTLLTVHM